MKKLKQGDMVIFTKNYRGYVQAGETRPIDKSIYIDNELSGVYIKLDHTWIYLDDTNFNEYCELKPKSFCKIGEDYKKSCDAIDKKLLTETIEQMKKSMLVKEYDYINPAHYRINGKETFDMMVLIWGVDNAIAHCEMTAFKYRMRAGKKPDQPIQRDLDKAKWYEDKAKELRDGKK